MISKRIIPIFLSSLAFALSGNDESNIIQLSKAEVRMLSSYNESYQKYNAQYDGYTSRPSHLIYTVLESMPDCVEVCLDADSQARCKLKNVSPDQKEMIWLETYGDLRITPLEVNQKLLARSQKIYGQLATEIKKRDLSQQEKKEMRERIKRHKELIKRRIAIAGFLAQASKHTTDLEKEIAGGQFLRISEKSEDIRKKCDLSEVDRLVEQAERYSPPCPKTPDDHERLKIADLLRVVRSDIHNGPNSMPEEIFDMDLDLPE